MSTLSKAQIQNIETLLKQSLRKKFQKYKPESKEMPFHTRLLGKDRMALYSFIQSVSTTLGTSIFEHVALELAKPHYDHAELKYKPGGKISAGALNCIDQIVSELIASEREADKSSEVRSLQACVHEGKLRSIKPTVVDFMVRTSQNEIYLFDIKTAKPNQGEFKGFKRTLLEWVGLELTNNPKAKVHTLIAIPYNPYAPEPYQRWTMKGLFDLDKELKVADEFWDFLGGKGTYDEVLNCFERVGIEMRKEIDDYFARFKQ